MQAPDSTWGCGSCLTHSSIARCLPPPSPDEAAAVVWFDAFVTNVDRTLRNVNILLHERRLWLIDHGAALFFHHNWKWLLQPEPRRPSRW